MEPGTEPIVASQWVIAHLKKILTMLSRAYRIIAKYRMPGLIILSVLASVIGGVAWQRLCKVNDWPFYLGGPNNEPYGLYAFVWGVITLFPVIASVRFFSTERDLSTPWKVLTWFVSRDSALILVYTILAGIVATVFYGWRRDIGVRAVIEDFPLSFEHTEMLIILVWAATLGALPSMAVRFLGGAYSSKKTSAILGIPSGLAMMLCILTLSVYFYSFDYEELDRWGQIRGFIAGPSLRFAIFWGLWLIVEGKTLQVINRRLLSFARNHLDSTDDPGSAS
jgi:hypothetical protein